MKIGRGNITIKYEVKIRRTTAAANKGSVSTGIFNLNKTLIKGDECGETLTDFF